jgi:hypothetical protein
MRKSFLCALVLAGAFLFAPAAQAQFTTVTATVQDPNGIPYAGAVLNAVLVPSTGGGYTLSGQPYAGRIGPVTLDSAGKFIVNFGDVTLITPGSPQWQITIDSAAATIAGPLGTGPQSFTFTSTGTTISGSSPVSLTTALNALAPKLTNFASGGSGTISCSISAAVLFETAANTAGCASTLTFLTASEKLLVGDPTSGLNAGTSLPPGTWAIQGIHQNTSASPKDVGVLGVVEADNGVSNVANAIAGGYFSASALTNLYTVQCCGTLVGVQGIATALHSTGTAGQVAGAIFTGNSNGAGPVGDLAGVAGQAFVAGTGLVAQASGIRVYTPGVSGGTPPTAENGVFINNIIGGVSNYAINISNQLQDSSHWAIFTGQGKNELGDQLILHGNLTFDGSSSGSAAINVPAAAGSPCTILLPSTSPTVGQFLSSAAPSGGNCVTSWSTAGTGTIAIPATVSGATSGGIPCFDSTTDMNTTAAITVNDAITGGGAGACAKDSGIPVYTGARAGVASNTAVGVGALASNAAATDTNDTAFGNAALNGVNGSGGSNTAMGQGAGTRVSSGSNNSMFGTASCNNTTTGTQMVCLGSNTQPNAAGDTNEIVIGFNFSGAGSNTATIGNASVTDVHNGGASDAALLHAKGWRTATNCAANGTAANPSVVSCTAAAAGMFSCATNASTGTCTVNTTAVTANSEITITQDAADGGAGQLNVTCNTGNVLSATAPVLAAKVAATSFTINLGTVSANPACFEYIIVN